METLDAIVTNILTAMTYGVPAYILIAFIHFVATRPIPQPDEPNTCTRVAQEQVAKRLDECIAMPIERPNATIGLAQPVSADQEILCEPVDWILWKVADLRCWRIRNIFGVSAEQNRRKLRKQELIDQYEDGFQKELVGCQLSSG